MSSARSDRKASDQLVWYGPILAAVVPFLSLTVVTFAEQKNGPVEVVGMLRSQEEKNAFTPENRPDKGEWVFSNIDEMAKFTGAEPVLVDEILGGSLPR